MGPCWEMGGALAGETQLPQVLEGAVVPCLAHAHAIEGSTLKITELIPESLGEHKYSWRYYHVETEGGWIAHMTANS